MMVVGGAIGGGFSWTLVNLDHFAFVGRLLNFGGGHHDGGGADEGNGWGQTGSKRSQGSEKYLWPIESCDSRFPSHAKEPFLFESAETKYYIKLN